MVRPDPDDTRHWEFKEGLYGLALAYEDFAANHHPEAREATATAIETLVGLRPEGRVRQECFPVAEVPESKKGVLNERGRVVAHEGSAWIVVVGFKQRPDARGHYAKVLKLAGNLRVYED